MKEETSDSLTFFTFWFLESLFLKILWNYLMPDLFNLPIITYWQALWLDMLCGIFFISTPQSYYLRKILG